MTPALSPNTQAILLLTAPLIAGRSTSSQGNARLGRASLGCTGEITEPAKSTLMRPVASRNRAKQRTVLAMSAVVEREKPFVHLTRN